MQINKMAELFANKAFKAGQVTNPIIFELKKKHGQKFIQKMTKGPLNEKNLSKKELKFVQKYSRVEFGPLYYKKGKKYYHIKKIG
jgi:hypothetical protein